MIWQQFEKDKEYLAKQYKTDHWDENSGLDKELLEEKCRYIAEAGHKSKSMKHAEMICTIFTKARLEINPYDWFQDKLEHGEVLADIENCWLREVFEKSDEEIKRKRYAAETCCAYTGEQDFGHCIPDWKRILAYGVPGLKKLAEEKMELCTEAAQKEFYLSCSMVADALTVLLRRMADAAEHMGEEFAKQKKVAQSLRNLSNGAPGNILEAMQLMLLYYEMQTFVEGTLIRSLGSIDALLYGFYVKDIENGTFTEEQIRELIDYFMYKLMAKDVTANVPMCIGAADENYAPNALSYVFLDEYGKLGIYDPKIHIRYNRFTPDKLLKLVFENIRRGHNSYVFLNDDVIASAFENIGMSKQESRDYALVGCYEPCINGKEVPCSCNGRINMPKALEAVLNRGKDVRTGLMMGVDTGAVSQIKTYDDFCEALKRQIDYFAAVAMQLTTDIERHYQEIHTAPMLSMSFESCMERGMDVYAGGAVYNNSSINAFGIANLVDSLEVIRYLVYENHEMEISEFAEIILNDWKGHEKLRLRCKKDFPKYGNGNREADELAAEFISYTASLINGQPNGRGGIFRFGAFSIDWRIYFGEKTWATPDGRLAGEALSKNIDSVTGQDKNGVTAMIRSAAKLDFQHIPNGTVLDITLHNTAVSGDEGMAAMLGLLKTYMKQGGMAIQFNVLDEKKLLEAQKDPEKYKNLQVRLCGWNVYYVNLSKKEQDDFIKQLRESR